MARFGLGIGVWAGWGMRLGMRLGIWLGAGLRMRLGIGLPAKSTKKDDSHANGVAHGVELSEYT